MTKPTESQGDATHNGRRTIGQKTPSPAATQDEMEPKGTPTSDRYNAETAHSSESDHPRKARTGRRAE